MLTDFHHMESLVRLQSPLRLAVVAAHSENTLRAVSKAAQGGLVCPTLIGDAPKIAQLLAVIPCPGAAVVHQPDGDRAAQMAADMVRGGQAQLVMKGAVETGRIMGVLLKKDTGLRAGGTMSLLAMMQSPYCPKVFGITDVGLLIAPTLEQKADAIRNAVGLFHRLGVDRPKVAVLAAVEKVNPKMPETVDALRLTEMAAQGLIPGCLVEGPMAYDLAMQRDAASLKGYAGAIAGDADLLVVPNIACGNVLSKALTATGGAKTCDVVLGAAVPLVIPSRSACWEDKYMSLVLAALAA